MSSLYGAKGLLHELRCDGGQALNLDQIRTFYLKNGASRKVTCQIRKRQAQRLTFDRVTRIEIRTN